MGRTRRGVTPEYKDEAVKLVINTGRTMATVARELGIQLSTLGRWVHHFKARAAAGEAGHGGVSETERAELLRLRGDNSDSKLDQALQKNVARLRPGSLGYEGQAFELVLRHLGISSNPLEKSNFTLTRMVRLLGVSRSGQKCCVTSNALPT